MKGICRGCLLFTGPWHSKRTKLKTPGSSLGTHGAHFACDRLSKCRRPPPPAQPSPAHATGRFFIIAPAQKTSPAPQLDRVSFVGRPSFGPTSLLSPPTSLIHPFTHSPTSTARGFNNTSHRPLPYKPRQFHFYLLRWLLCLPPRQISKTPELREIVVYDKRCATSAALRNPRRSASATNGKEYWRPNIFCRGSVVTACSRIHKTAFTAFTALDN
jgi:hypothetical protein